MIQFLLLFLFIWDGLSWPHSVALLSLELTTIFFAVLEQGFEPESVSIMVFVVLI